MGIIGHCAGGSERVIHSENGMVNGSRMIVKRYLFGTVPMLMANQKHSLHVCFKLPRHTGHGPSTPVRDVPQF